MVGGLDLGASAYWTHPGVRAALGPDGWSGGYDIEVLAMPLSADHTTPQPGFDSSKDIYLEYVTMPAVADGDIDQDGVEIADVSSCAPEHGGADTPSLGYFAELVTADLPVPSDGQEFAPARINWYEEVGSFVQRMDDPLQDGEAVTVLASWGALESWGRATRKRVVFRAADPDVGGHWSHTVYYPSTSAATTDWTDTAGRSWTIAHRRHGSTSREMLASDNEWHIGLNPRWRGAVQSVTVRDGVDGTVLLDFHADDVDEDGRVRDRASGEEWAPDGDQPDAAFVVDEAPTPAPTPPACPR